MALLNVPATKSALLALRRQLSFAEEGYALLDQKREILLLELAASAAKAARARRRAGEELAAASALLREAELDAGAAAVDRAAAGVRPGAAVDLKERRLMGLRLPSASSPAAAPGLYFGASGTPAGTAAAAAAYAGLLSLLAELAGLETSAARLALELKKTQRRCNALSKKMIPDCRETIGYLAGALEERERESFVILRMVRDRLRAAREAAG